jgi:CDP-diglyceride synthetase
MSQNEGMVVGCCVCVCVCVCHIYIYTHREYTYVYYIVLIFLILCMCMLFDGLNRVSKYPYIWREGVMTGGGERG